MVNKVKVTEKRRSWVVLAAVLLAVFVCYFPSLFSQFVNWDDEVHLLNNLSIRALDREHLIDMFTQRVNMTYVPLTSLSFALEYHFFGFNPFVYHLDNVLLHLVIVVLIYALGLRLGLAPGASALASFIFGIHPMHVESVVWVTERKDVLYAFFYLLAVWQYLNFSRQPQGWRYALVLLFGTLSMLAKPMALSLPLILFLLDWFERKPWRPEVVWQKIPLLIILAGLGWMTYSVHLRLPSTNGPLESLLVWIWTFVFYIRQFWFPQFFVPIYDLPKPVGWANPEYIVSLAVFLALILFVYRLQRNRWVMFAFLFYVLSIFFLLRFDDAKDINVVADRFMYLPSLGMCFLIGAGAQWLASRIEIKPALWRWATGGVSLLAILFLALKANAQVLVWRDSITLLKHQLAFEPFQPLALNNLASAYREQKDYKKAITRYRAIMELRRQGLGDQALDEETQKMARRIDYLVSLYQESIRQDPNYEYAYLNLGNLYKEAGMIPEAVKLYQQTIRIAAKFKDAYLNLGSLFIQLGEPRLAIEAFNQIILLEPDNDDVYFNIVQTINEGLKKSPHPEILRHRRDEILETFTVKAFQSGRTQSLFNLGVLYAESGDYEQAIRAFRQIIEQNPRHTKAIYALGKVYEKTNNFKDAQAAYQEVLRIDANYIDAYLSLGQTFALLGQQTQAIDLFRKALTINPEHPRAHFNLGFIFEVTGQRDLAIEHYQKAIQYDPDNAEAYYNLGNIYALQDQLPQAIALYQQAIAINPDHLDAYVNLSILCYKLGDYRNAIKYNDLAQTLGYRTPSQFQKILEEHSKNENEKNTGYPAIR